MPRFIAVKIHYDHRERLPAHLKYSCLPTSEEYQEYLDRYASENEGGNGFHECLNFSLSDERAEYKIYLPPTCIPSEKYADEEFVIFYFTYKTDPELPSQLIGVHAGARFLDMDGIYRDEDTVSGIDEQLFYHAETHGQLGTLFSSTLQYDFNEGKYTPAYKLWGYGLRYIEAEHAKKILQDAFENATKKLNHSSKAERIFVKNEIDVLSQISVNYFGEDLSSGQSGLPKPDLSIGYHGEEAVYNRELKFAAQKGIHGSRIEWLSQSIPTSVFDIKTVREVDGELVDHFLEVKSSSMKYGENAYLSDRQLKFFEENTDSTSLVLVNFSTKNAEPSIRYLSFSEIKEQFEFEPVKYKLKIKS